MFEEQSRRLPWTLDMVVVVEGQGKNRISRQRNEEMRCICKDCINLPEDCKGGKWYSNQNLSPYLVFFQNVMLGIQRVF